MRQAIPISLFTTCFRLPYVECIVFTFTGFGMTLPVRNGRIRLPQGQMFWREVGQGHVVVFLHGAWWTGEQWTKVVQSLSHDYHCFVPDLLGFGESEKPKTHYSIQLEVECLMAYLKLLRIKRCVLVGYGLGAWVAATYALTYPDAVSSLILAAPEGVINDKLQGRWRGWRRLSSPIPLIGWLLRVRLAFPTILGGGRSLQSTMRLRRVLRQSPTACQLLFKRRRAELHAEYLQDRLPNLRHPTLILQSEQDSPITIAMAQLYAQAPHSVIEVTPTLCSPEPWKGTNHPYTLDTGANTSTIENPDVISEAIAPLVKTFINKTANP